MSSSEVAVASVEQRSPQRADFAVVAAVLGLGIVGTTQIEPAASERVVDGLTFACVVVAAGSLLWWRRWTMPVASVVSAVVALYLARNYPPGPGFLPVPLAMLAVGYVASKEAAWLGVAGLSAATAIGTAIGGEAILPHVLFAFGWGAASVLAGQAISARGERAATEQAHAQEQALADERLRIAQDIHDSVAHAMATINVQSGVAGHLINHKPEQAAVSLEAIRTASRDALEELSSILGILRNSDSGAPLSPLAGLRDIEELVQRARVDGVSVTIDKSGDVESVPPSVGVAAYRAVQEALTNTRRHAGPDAVAAVTIAACERGSLHIRISDDGGIKGRKRVAGDRKLDHSSSGFGLVGMRERIGATGGSLVVGPAPAPSDGFVVDISWPPRADR